MRHLAAFAVGAASLAGAGALLDAIAARTPSEGVVWVVTRGAAAPALGALLASGDARVVNVWMGGRVVQLHVSSTRDAALSARSTWVALRLSQSSFAWPGCG